MASERILSKEEIETALNERHSPEKQKLLSVGQVTIAGLGGLGSNVAYSVARIGVGHLHLIDFDVVDITNLNRQQYFMEHIGMYKTDALKSLLLKINPYLDIRTDCVKVTDDAVLQGQETILPEEVKKAIRDAAQLHAKDILGKLRELQVDLRTNPAIFIGGGSVLFRPLIEHTPLVAKATFIEDPKANAIGYEMLARGQMAMRAVQ